MSIHSNQPNPGQAREINLQQMAEQFMVGLQRHFDMLAFNLASREAVTEEAYNDRVRAPRVMPAAAVHQNFEQLQAYSRDLLLLQTINDALNLAVACTSNAHLFLALLKANKEHGGPCPEAQQKTQEVQQQFLQAPLDQKFNRLEESYGVMCELEDTIASLGFAVQALAQQGGVVKDGQLDSSGELQIELKAAKPGVPPGDVWRQPEALETVQKVFRSEQKIEFSDTEIQNILLTIAVFSHQLFSAVAEYARENKPEA